MNACDDMLAMFTLGLAAIGGISVAVTAVGLILVTTITIPNLLRD